MLGFTTLFGEPFFPETAKVLHTGVASTAFPTSTMAGAERRQMILISGGFSRAMFVSFTGRYPLNLGHTYLKLEGSRDGVCG